MKTKGATQPRALARRLDTMDASQFIDRWTSERQFFADLVKSGFLPDNIKTPEHAMAQVLAGKELGLSAMYSLRKLSVIKGMVVMSGEAMMAKIHASGQLADMQIEGNNTACKVMMKRTNGVSFTDTFTMEDAARMKMFDKESGKAKPLSEKYNYVAMPKVMLRWRAIASVARIVFADIIGGVYLPEEVEDIMLTEPEMEVVVPNVREQIAVASGVNAEVFDCTKEVFMPYSDATRQYDGMTWLQLPQDFLAYLANKGDANRKLLAKSTLDYIAELERQAPKADNPIDDAFGKQQPIAPPQPQLATVDTLLASLNALVERKATKREVMTWRKAPEVSAMFGKISKAEAKQVTDEFNRALKSAK